ncbi:membrane metallo-endopeptidase-like 1 [Dermacentor silvarum]|uniref:membrane metallo-endopeptidase-like 1 n=1 Tax=Dermacentor silvarum TaxID=543639 RepID=UPI0021014D23|nr:membrane metallo-endopeptidase-like 1 [Dermacentor silvarum]
MSSIQRLPPEYQLQGPLATTEMWNGSTILTALGIAEKIRETFNATIYEADWLNNSTSVMEQKLKNMTLAIGFPDNILNTTYLDGLYEHVPRFSANTTLFEMLYHFKQNTYWKQLALLRVPRQRDRWVPGAINVGAFYSPVNNQMEIPWAMLHAPFFQSGLPRSLNFGALGGLMAHEMLHAFDASAMRKIKGPSSIELDPNATAAFEDKIKCFFSQYKNATKTLWKNINATHFEDSQEDFDKNQFEGRFRKLAEEMKLLFNGVKYARTLDDDIVDNGGLQTAFMAYSKVLENECDGIDTRLQGMDHFSGRQLFFVSWASTFCRNVTKEGILRQIENDAHSPEQLRVNLALRNFPPFAEAFSCSNTSYMNPPDTERCTLW